MARARVLVVGAGALGNEVIKNLALLGVGRVVVVDRDRVEASNLSRSVLFSEEDEGASKAACAAARAGRISAVGRFVPMEADVVTQVGLGYFRWAEVVVGAVDNREARVFINRACARVGRPWIDGGIDVLDGIVRGFAPPATACYECTMSETDWQILNQRRSCSLLARRAEENHGVPTTPTTASVIGGIQAQEVLKLLHQREALLGRGFVFEGANHTSYAVGYAIDPECPWHDPAAPVEAKREWTSATSLADLWGYAERSLGGLEAIDLGREVIATLACAECGTRTRVLRPAESIGEEEVLCPVCGSERTPTPLHSLSAGSEWLSLTVAELGLPPWDILWARRGEQRLGLEMAGDSPFLAEESRPHCEWRAP